jgi:peptidoglycan/xylan/chitin deacetylase (PgdA/CDA1 family)
MELVKRIGAIAARSAELSGFLALVERASESSEHRLRVLMYHRVAEPESEPDLNPGLISARPAEFAQQMRFLAGRYRVLSLGEVLECCRKERALPPRAVLLTFDDAYRDFADHAWPVLRALGLPATLFVPTAYPDRPGRAFWWDRLYAAVVRAPGEAEVDTPHGRLPRRTPAERRRAFGRLRELVKDLPHERAMDLVDRVCDRLDPAPVRGRVLGWEALRRLRAEGLTLAPHTRTHALLHRVARERLREEIAGSLCDLERETGPAPAVLAYPSGGFDDQVVRVLEEEGFELGFTCIRGVSHLRIDDRLRLRRIPVGRRLTGPLLRAQMVPWASELGRLLLDRRPRAVHVGGPQL